jgi:hypothetical protein
MLVILDRQHFGKPPPSQNDRGVAVDRNGNGNAETNEASLTPRYINACKVALEAAGHTVVVEDSGWYRDRHARANARANALPASARPAAYVACHLNAGGGDYGLVVHDGRSAGGAKLAAKVSEGLRKAFTTAELARVLVRPGSSTDWANAYGTISGIYAGPSWLSAICFEPVFVDSHRALVSDTNLDRIGKALAAGLTAWATGATRAPRTGWFDDGERLLDGRDPRWNPAIGDLLSLAGRVRSVVDVDKANVVLGDWPELGDVEVLTLDAFRVAYEGARVVHA